jgi:hypothetical protein
MDSELEKTRKGRAIAYFEAVACCLLVRAGEKYEMLERRVSVRAEV